MMCKCIKGSKWHNIQETNTEGVFEFEPGVVYPFFIERHGFWGDSYMVRNGTNVTGWGVKNHINTIPGRAFTDYFEIIDPRKI